ncbi:Flagellar basal-body rod protein FlgC [Aquicella siphonis]|uniref:Flagellar basal-body rod protein FlgC n=1 Tax=Aquicella siphonis TaxID=254247 RepID=A0A5E4PLJ1_9COXI|nr:flagellar basal body rod protein FlgC [Aquicella siphonis]VVC77096.1 Flagellar basal-body rod protein FlgC [Aquicella siphonis]
MSAPIKSLEQVLTNAASGLSAQSIRMNTIASNLANAGSVGSTEESTYHTKYPVFSEVKQGLAGMGQDDQPVGGVRVSSVKDSQKPLEKRYEPSHPLADKDGYVYMTDVNPISEMTNMISASKEYQANVEIMNTTKNLIMQTLSVINTK